MMGRIEDMFSWDGVAIDDGVAPRGAYVAGELLDQRGLACSIVPQQGEDLAALKAPYFLYMPLITTAASWSWPALIEFSSATTSLSVVFPYRGLPPELKPIFTPGIQYPGLKMNHGFLFLP